VVNEYKKQRELLKRFKQEKKVVGGGEGGTTPHPHMNPLPNK
jgi:hypothetical protein